MFLPHIGISRPLLPEDVLVYSAKTETFTARDREGYDLYFSDNFPAFKAGKSAPDSTPEETAEVLASTAGLKIGEIKNDSLLFEYRLCK